MSSGYTRRGAQRRAHYRSQIGDDLPVVVRRTGHRDDGTVAILEFGVLPFFPSEKPGEG